MKRKLKETISVQDAMDNIAAIANIDMNDPPPLGIVKDYRLVTTEEEFASDTVQWLGGEGAEPILEILDLTYQTILKHLIHLYEGSLVNWESEKSRKGTAAMMDLVGESAAKIEAFLEMRIGEELSKKISEIKSFRDLQTFYSKKFSKKFVGGVEGSNAWSDEWGEEESFVDLSESGLKDFETVKRDCEYELFYIRNEEGEPYFNAELLRNVRLSCDFDIKAQEFEEDPLLKNRAVQDRDVHASASQMISECYPAITDYFKFWKNLEGNELASSLGMALIALFLAANPRYLLQNTVGKSCLQYFDDFHFFLRRSLRTKEYQKMMAYPPDKTDKASLLLLYLVHALCHSLFLREGGVKSEAIGLIHRSMRRGEEVKKKGKKRLVKGETVWNQFLLDDEKFRSLLAKFPNGPLLKILDFMREEQTEETMIPFDPIGQHNLPLRLFQIQRKGKKIDVIHLPSPTKQTYIHKAEIVDEFLGFLRSLQNFKSGKKHLLINLQDRTLWKGFARCRTVENLQNNAEFSRNIFVITLPKHTDFYYQNNAYLNMNKAQDFLNAFQEQIESGEESGYFFPSVIKKDELLRFTKTTLQKIHELFFEGKNTLTRRNREDFIEIFYQFLLLKCIDIIGPSSMSFSCKDGIDVGAAASGAFYGFCQLLEGDFSKKQTQDYLRWLLYTPAYFYRERAIDPERLNRTISCLEKFDQEMAEVGKKVLKTFQELLSDTKSLIIGE